jgi:hypothetical protein
MTTLVELVRCGPLVRVRPQAGHRPASDEPDSGGRRAPRRMGRSGSGKTTLLWLVGGRDKPSAGRVLVTGQGVGALKPKQLAILRRSSAGPSPIGARSDPCGPASRTRPGHVRLMMWAPVT